MPGRQLFCGTRSTVLHDDAGHRLEGAADLRRQAVAGAEVELHLLAVVEGDEEADRVAPPALARQQALQALQRSGRRAVDVEALGGARGGVVERLQRLRGEARLVALAVLGRYLQKPGLAAVQQLAARSEEH